MTNSVEELFDVLDDEGRAIGTAPRSRVHREGLWHRSVHVLVFHPDGRLLLQKRSASKDTCPGLWDSSVGGHVGAGEDPFASALRETREELGIDLLPAQLAFAAEHVVDLPGDTDRERVLCWTATHAGPFAPDPVELESIGWFSRDEIDSMLERGVCTPNFRVQWDAWLRGRMPL
jgi:isopentenyldiphosphate isomerase